ncbi:MAG TPA: enoyl-CoA hydratase [Aquihabitans sp.]|nr:enoyl-CoA hydratase [Aquihabitans sp.]
MELVDRRDRGGVATLTLRRPEARNALSLAVLDALVAHLAAVDDDRSVRVVVLAAEGPAFSAGHDLRELAAAPDDAARARVFERCSEAMVALVELRVPVIAAVGGIATAAGCQLVASCDLAVASSAARFATPGVDIGLFCTTPAVALQRTVAPKHAMELLLTGEPISAHDAWRIGLVNRVVEPEALASEVGALAELIAAKPAATVESGKASVRRLGSLALRDAYREASAAMASGLVAPEAVEGIGAFLEKRSPRWPER